MKLFKKQISIKKDELFKENGEFNLTQDLANMLDTILIISMVKGAMDLYNMNLELRRCGFFISHPELKEIVAKLIKDGLVGEGTPKLAMSDN